MNGHARRTGAGQCRDWLLAGFLALLPAAAQSTGTLEFVHADASMPSPTLAGSLLTTPANLDLASPLFRRAEARAALDRVLLPTLRERRMLGAAFDAGADNTAPALELGFIAAR